MPNTYPALHNAMWPGLVGKGPDSEPPIDLETMLCLTASANVNGVRFDGVDLFLSLPHTDIDSSDDDLARLADNLNAKGLRAGSLVAPVWPAHRRRIGHGQRCRARGVSDAGAQVLPYRAASSATWAFASTGSCASTRRPVAGEWAKDPEPATPNASPTRSARPCDIAEGFRRAARGRGRDLLGGHA